MVNPDALRGQRFYGGPDGPNHGSPRGLLDIDGWQFDLGRRLLLVEDLPQPTTWYRTPVGIGLCGEDPEALPAQVVPALTHLFEGLASLDLRNEVLGGDTSSEALIAHAVAAYETLDAYLGLSCSGNA